MAIKVTIDDKEVDITPEQIKFPDGYGLITPESVPKGYFTQEALNKTIQERLERDRQTQREKLAQDPEFRSNILSELNISLDEKGQPKGLKPDFDPEEWKRNKIKEITDPYEKKLSEKETKLNSFKRGLIKSEVMKSASSLFREEFLKSYTGADDPFVVKQFADQFDVNDDGSVIMRDKEGGFAVSNDGSYITPSTFFESNRDKFADLLRDERQKGTGTNAGGSNGRFSAEQIKGMSDAEYEANRESILDQTSKGNIR